MVWTLCCGCAVIERGRDQGMGRCDGEAAAEETTANTPTVCCRPVNRHIQPAVKQSYEPVEMSLKIMPIMNFINVF